MESTTVTITAVATTTNKNVCYNAAYLIGTLLEDFTFDCEYKNAKMFTSFISVKRTSGNEDILPLIISERVLNKMPVLSKGMTVSIKGHIASFNKRIEDRNKLCVFVRCSRIDLVAKDTAHENKFIVEGYVCKEVNYRETPGMKDKNGNIIKKSSKITDIILAVNTKNPKTSYYIPCITWNKIAQQASYLKVGDKINVNGRLQSRSYIKEKFTGENKSQVSCETCVAYELSINKFSTDIEDRVKIVTLSNEENFNF